MRTAVASLVICATGGALVWRGTDGFRAFTTEQARRNAVARSPRTLPEIALDDQDGQPFTLSAGWAWAFERGLAPTREWMVSLQVL